MVSFHIIWCVHAKTDVWSSQEKIELAMSTQEKTNVVWNGMAIYIKNQKQPLYSVLKG